MVRGNSGHVIEEGFDLVNVGMDLDMLEVKGGETYRGMF